MGKVLEEHYTPFIGVDESENRLVVYVDSTDEEGYGVVFGDHDADRTIVFGHSVIGHYLAFELFHSIQNEIEYKLVDGRIDPQCLLEFESLESPIEVIDEEEGDESIDDNEMNKIINYIAEYGN